MSLKDKYLFRSELLMKNQQGGAKLPPPNQNRVNKNEESDILPTESLLYIRLLSAQIESKSTNYIYTISNLYPMRAIQCHRLRQNRPPSDQIEAIWHFPDLYPISLMV